MVQNSSVKKRRKRKLPDDALTQGDRHLMKTLFGDKVMDELDKLTGDSKDDVDVSMPRSI